MTLANVDIIIHELVQAGDLRQDNPSHYNRIEWLIIHNACKKDREQSDDNDGGDNSPPGPREISNETLRDKQNPIPYLTGSSEARDPKSLNRWSYRPVWRYRTSLNSDAFIEKCREAIDKVREKKKVEANDQPISGGNGKRKLQMDSKLRTWLIETDGTKKSISCREICEKFESNIVTRLPS